jgi:hypothetical protein
MDLDSIIQNFKSYRTSHPNLANCWLAYLGLKKEHYVTPSLAAQCAQIFAAFENGYNDLNAEDIVRVMLYQESL